MKLPGWLTGTKTSILPDPSTHMDISAEALVDWIKQGQRFRLVAFPGLEGTLVHPVDGWWPLITSVHVNKDNAVVIQAEDEPDAAFYLLPAGMVTVAPA